MTDESQWGAKRGWRCANICESTSDATRLTFAFEHCSSIYNKRFSIKSFLYLVLHARMSHRLAFSVNSALVHIRSDWMNGIPFRADWGITRLSLRQKKIKLIPQLFHCIRCGHQHISNYLSRTCKYFQTLKYPFIIQRRFT